MRVRFQKHTVQGRVPALDAMYAQHFARVAPGIEVEIGTLPAAAYASDLPEGMVRYGAAESLFAVHFMSEAIAAERDGCDAFVVGTSQDPGLREARSVVSIPVVGYGETAFHLVALSGLRFAVVGFIPELATPLLSNIRAAGQADRFVGFRHISGGTEAIHRAFAGDADDFLEQFQQAARQLIAEGAEAIIPGEGLPNELLVHHGVHEIDGAPVVDADGLAVRYAAFLVELRRHGILGGATAGYWNRPLAPAVIDTLRGAFLAPNPDGRPRP